MPATTNAEILDFVEHHNAASDEGTHLGRGMQHARDLLESGHGYEDQAKESRRQAEAATAKRLPRLLGRKAARAVRDNTVATARSREEFNAANADRALTLGAEIVEDELRVMDKALVSIASQDDPESPPDWGSRTAWDLGNKLLMAVPKPIQEDYSTWVEEQGQEGRESKNGFLRWLHQGATYEQRVNVLQWHDDHMRLLNGPEGQKRVEAVKQQFIEGINNLIADGRLSPSMKPDPEKVNNVPVVFGDFFSTNRLKVNGMTRYRDGIGRIIMHNDPESETLHHELFHAVYGGLNRDLSAVDTMIDEVATDIFAIMNYEQAGDRGLDVSKSVYSNCIELVSQVTGKSAEELAMDFSNFYAGSDWEANAAQLQAYWKETTGKDVAAILGVLDKTGDLMYETYRKYNIEKKAYTILMMSEEAASLLAVA